MMAASVMAASVLTASVMAGAFRLESRSNDHIRDDDISDDDDVSDEWFEFRRHSAITSVSQVRSSQTGSVGPSGGVIAALSRSLRGAVHQGWWCYQ